MATLAELLTAACADGFAAETSQVRLLQLIAQLSNTSNMTVDEIMAEACETGIADVTSPQKLLVLIAQLSQSGGGGGGGTNNLNGSGSPVGVETPDYTGQMYIDTDPPYALWMAVGPTNADWVQAS